MAVVGRGDGENSSKIQVGEPAAHSTNKEWTPATQQRSDPSLVLQLQGTVQMVSGREPEGAHPPPPGLSSSSAPGPCSPWLPPGVLSLCSAAFQRQKAAASFRDMSPLHATRPMPLEHPGGSRKEGFLLGQDRGRPGSVEVDNLPFAIPAVPDAGLL